MSSSVCPGGPPPSPGGMSGAGDGCLPAMWEGSFGSNPAAGDPVPGSAEYLSVDADIPGFDGQEKMVIIDGEAHFEFYDAEGNHLGTISAEEFGNLCMTALEDSQEGFDARSTLAGLGMSPEAMQGLIPEGNVAYFKDPSSDQWYVVNSEGYEYFDSHEAAKAEYDSRVGSNGTDYSGMSFDPEGTEGVTFSDQTVPDPASPPDEVAA